jgi:hypothetical protein
MRANLRVYFYNYDTYWQKDALQSDLWTLGQALLVKIDSSIRREREVSYAQATSNQVD